MTPEEVRDVLGAEIVCEGDNLSQQLTFAFAADLMSDVLRLDTSEMLLITGLANTQVLRTAEMADISCILFVRDKDVTEEMKEMAEDHGCTILRCKDSMFKVCGLLYKAGLKPIF